MAPTPGPRIWTIRRKLVANILPLACGAPFLGLAVWLWVVGLGWDAVAAAAASLVASAVSLNWLGLVGNRQMRTALETRLKPAGDAVFVGFSRPGYFDLLDPHEDIGFLVVNADELRVKGELRELRIQREPGLRIGYAFNPHSLLGLGRWLVLKGSTGEGPVRVHLEPRQRGSLWANRGLGIELRAQLEAWRDKV